MSAATEYGSVLLSQHADLLRASGVTPDVAAERGYHSADTKAQLERHGFGVRQRRVPALLIPVHDVYGEVRFHQARPDSPRELNGKVVKYETPIGTSMAVDVHPRVHPHLGDPSRLLVVTEGVRKADACVSRGLDAVALNGLQLARQECAGRVDGAP